MVKKVDENNLRARRQRVLGRLAIRFVRGYQETLRERAYAGHEVLTPAHNRVLIHLDHEGTRAVVLAQRARITKQAMSQLLRHLEQHGYVERRPDPRDKRARLVHFTEKGRGLLEHSLDHLEALDREIHDLLGDQAQAFVDALHTLADHFDPPEPNINL